MLGWELSKQIKEYSKTGPLVWGGVGETKRRLTQHGPSAYMPRTLSSPAVPGQPPPSGQPVPKQKGGL